MFRCLAKDRAVTSNSFHFCGARKKKSQGYMGRGRREAREETCPGVKLRHPWFFVFPLFSLSAKNDALFMGPKGEERLWPK